VPAPSRNDVAFDGGFWVGGVSPIVVLRLAVSPSMVVLGLAVLPSKQFVCMAELVSTVIARRVVDKLDCTGGFRRSNLLEKGNLAKKGFGNGGIVLSRIVLAG
jgi:hypothetical protein